jgi:hypothetical protein
MWYVDVFGLEIKMACLKQICRAEGHFGLLAISNKFSI